MNVGILGGTRFIGFHLAESLLANGATVTIFHRGRTTEPRPFSGPLNRVLGDRNETSTLAEFFSRNYDAVIDLSGLNVSHVGPILTSWRGRIGHYLFCSTSAVYREPPPVDCDEEVPLEYEPGTYGGDKALAERAIFRASHQYRWPATVFRPHAVFGPFGANQALYVFRRLSAEEQPLIRPESVGKRTNFLWVQDFVDCMLAAIGESRTFGEAFNVAGPEVCTPHKFSRVAGEVCGSNAVPLVIERRIASRLPSLGLAWSTYDLFPRTDKLTKNIVAAHTSLADGLEGVLAWAKAEPGLLQSSPQRWEQQAVQGKVPSRGIEFYWRLQDDALRAVRLASRIYRRGRFS